MNSHTFDRLESARRERATTLCVGIDPRLEKIPSELRARAGQDVRSLLTRFGVEILELVADVAACVKPQIAFFEAHGLPGLAAYAAVLAEARRRGVVVIGDVKRGDIGSTAEAYARGHLTRGADFEVDALTLNPYLGEDALAPFVDEAARAGKGVYVLVRTSNPGARDLQELPTGADDEKLFEKTANLVRRMGEARARTSSGFLTVGAVVGATAPAAVSCLRTLLPDTPFLVPGYGAQGASASDVAAAYRGDGSGAVVNASRSIIHPPVEPGTGLDGWRAAVSAAAAKAREELYAAGLHSS